jgi:hypothetical protein
LVRFNISFSGLSLGRDTDAQRDAAVLGELARWRRFRMIAGR